MTCTNLLPFGEKTEATLSRAIKAISCEKFFLIGLLASFIFPIFLSELEEKKER